MSAPDAAWWPLTFNASGEARFPIPGVGLFVAFRRKHPTDNVITHLMAAQTHGASGTALPLVRRQFESMLELRCHLLNLAGEDLDDLHAFITEEDTP
jgi:hypothetical protein